jgi:hypothetical protein
MPAAKDVKAGGAFIELFTKDSAMMKGLDAASAKLRAWGAGLRSSGASTIAAGTAMLAPFLASAKIFDSMGSALNDMSDRTGVSVEQLSSLGYAADQTGTSMEAVEGGLRRLARFSQTASEGGKAAVDTLADLGLQSKALEGLTPDQQFLLIAEALDKVADPGKRAALAMEVFGKNGTSLLPMMKGGSKALQDYAAHAAKLGLIISTEDAKAADEFGDTLGDLWKVMKMSAFSIGASLAPALQWLAATLASGLARVNAWIREHRLIVIIAASAATAVIALGVAMYGLGVVMSGLGFALVAVKAVLSVIGGLMAVLASPIGLVIAGVLALGAVLVWFTGVGSTVVDFLAGVWKTLKDDALKAFKGISDALAAGDIKLAAEILWVSLQLVWQRGVNFLSGIWQAFTSTIASVALKGFYGILAAWTWVSSTLESAWIATTAFLGGLWDGFVSSMASAWNTVSTAIVKGWNYIKAAFTDFDAEAANKALDEQVSQNEQARQAQDMAAAKAREQARATAAQRNDEDYKKRMADLVKQEADAQAMLQSQDMAKVKAGEEKLAALIKQRDELNATAQQEAATAKEMKETAEAPVFVPPDLSAAQLTNAVEAAQPKYSAAGSFNANAARSLLQTGSPFARIAKATEDTARNTKRIAERDALEFAD